MSRGLRVSTHAAIRMCERAFGIKNPTPPQIEHAKIVIVQEVLANYPDVVKLKNGIFKLNEFGVSPVIEDGTVATVKDLASEGSSRELNGGRFRSGNSYAKKLSKKSIESRNEMRKYYKNKKKTPKETQ